MSASICPTRSSASPSASTVRAPSTVSLRVALIVGVRRALAQVAVLGARQVPPQADDQRGQRQQAGQSTHQPTLSAAPSVSTAVTMAMVHSGSAIRTDQPSWSTSRLVRVSRSPEPADSTTPIGRAEGVVDEVLAQLGEHLLAEHLADRAGRSG